jgi:hypothetical protein
MNFQLLRSIVFIGLIRAIAFDHLLLNADEPPANGAVEAISTAERVDREIFFETNVRGILVGKCLNCHGGAKRESSYSVNSRNEILKGGRLKKTIVSGKSAESPFLKFIQVSNTTDKTKYHFISEIEFQQIKRWIDDGVIWPATDPFLKMK